MQLTSFLVFDIETRVKTGDEKLDELLEHKLRNTPPEEYDLKKEKYQFLNPVYAEVVAISTVYAKSLDDPNPTKKVFVGEEFEILSKFSEYLYKFQGLYVHFNGLDFDVPFLLFRMAVHSITPPNQRFCNLIRFRTDPHYDLMHVLGFWRNFPISLQEACHAFGIEDPKVNLKGKSTTEFIRTATQEELCEYSIGDAVAEFKLFKKVYPIFS